MFWDGLHFLFLHKCWKLTDSGRFAGLSRPQSELEEDKGYQGDGEGLDYDGEDQDEDYEDEAQGPPPVMQSSAITLLLDVGDVAFLPCDVEGNPGMYIFQLPFIKLSK